MALIDCHSFPSQLSDVDVCIGYNEDFSEPDVHVINVVRSIFEKRGYKVGINTPYQNSIQPQDEEEAAPGYCSLIIELNKRTYMDEESLLQNERFADIKSAITEVYKFLLYEEFQATGDECSAVSGV